ncbi:MAG: tRNA-dihydrouridine synthase, partial [Gemmatimonadaceae bacterium]
VADCVRAMREKLSIPVTVKHRTGIDEIETYDFLARFVDVVSRAGCSTFIVHARNAILKGLSPKENREVPPLRYQYVYRLKRDFPHLEIVVNGGITTWSAIDGHLSHVDGVMLGRAAYHDTWVLADPGKTRAGVVRAMAEYARGLPALRLVARHMLGLYHGHPRARLWRRLLSDPARLSQNDPNLLLDALQAVESGAKEIPHERRPQAEELQARP